MREKSFWMTQEEIREFEEYREILKNSDGSISFLLDNLSIYAYPYEFKMMGRKEK